MYVIGNLDNGKFVADMRKSRDGHSYTRDLRQAKIFDAKEKAERERCPGNEQVVSVRMLLEC